MSSDITQHQSATGSMSSRLVAALAGVTAHRLRQWRRSGIVVASALPPRRGVQCAYRWDEYRRARVAALLLTHGLQPRNLRGVLDEYCEVIAPNSELPTTVAGQRAIVKPENGRGHTAERERQGTAFDFVSAASLDEEMIARRLGAQMPDGVAPIDVLKEFSRGWPLGQLQEYADVVDVRPDVMGGAPTLKGRRLETAALSSLHQAGDSIDTIGDAYELPSSTVKRVIAFERALDQHASAAG